MAENLAGFFAMDSQGVEAALGGLTQEQAEAVMFEAADAEPYTEHVEAIRNAAAERAGWGGLNLGRAGTVERGRAWEVKRRNDDLKLRYGDDFGVGLDRPTGGA